MRLELEDEIVELVGDGDALLHPAWSSIDPQAVEAIALRSEADVATVAQMVEQLRVERPDARVLQRLLADEG